MSLPEPAIVSHLQQFVSPAIRSVPISKTVANSKAQSSEFRQPVENSLTILSPQMCRAMEWKSSIIFPTKHVNNILFAINNKK